MYISIDFIAVSIIYLAIVTFLFVLIIFGIHYIFLGIKLASERLCDYISERWFDGGRNTPLPISLVAKRKAAEVEAEVLKHIPAPAKYKHDRNKSVSSCAICLEELKDGELCRALPDCNHAFHDPCIKPWLIKNQSCPICRVSTSTRDHKGHDTGLTGGI